MPSCELYLIKTPEFESFDEQPIPDLNSEALDFRAASELFAPVRKLAPSAFRNLRVTTEHHGREVPAGMGSSRYSGCSDGGR